MRTLTSFAGVGSEKKAYGTWYTKKLCHAFFLVCCYEHDCVHPICQTGNRKEVYWFPSGPSLSLLPIPTPDPAGL